MHPVAVILGPVDAQVTFETGIITDDDTDAIVEGARVALVAPTLSEPLVAITDAHGQYAFANVPLGRGGCMVAVLRVTADGYVPLRVPGNLYVNESYERELTLSRQRNLSEPDAATCENMS
jgi:hypothetical protein